MHAQTHTHSVSFSLCFSLPSHLPLVSITKLDTNRQSGCLKWKVNYSWLTKCSCENVLFQNNRSSYSLIWAQRMKPQLSLLSALDKKTIWIPKKSAERIVIFLEESYTSKKNKICLKFCNITWWFDLDYTTIVLLWSKFK